MTDPGSKPGQARAVLRLDAVETRAEAALLELAHERTGIGRTERAQPAVEQELRPPVHRREQERDAQAGRLRARHPPAPPRPGDHARCTRRPDTAATSRDVQNAT